MKDAPDEADRLAALKRLEIVDTVPEQAYDDLTLIASQACGAPIALISFVDDRRQWLKSKIGLTVDETPRAFAFCAHAIETPEKVFVVEDAVEDLRFADNPLVTGAPWIRFYAGAPIVAPDGYAMGALAVIDTRPRHFEPDQERSLVALARQASALLALRDATVVAEARARAETALSSDEKLKRQRGAELLELVLQGGAMGLWDLHVPTGRWTVNAREQEMLGWSEAAPMPPDAGWRRLVHPDDWPVLQAAIAQHLEGRTPFYDAVIRLRHRDGRWLWIHSRAVVVESDASGTPVRVVGTHVDITAARLDEDRRRQDAERLALALAGGDLGMWDWEVKTGRVVRNEQWARIFGYTLAESEADGFWSTIVHPDDLAPSQAGMQRHLDGHTAMFEAEVRMRHRDGQWLWVLQRAKVVDRDADGHAIRVVGTTMNITAKKADSLALERATEMLSRTGELARVGGWEMKVDGMALRWSDEIYRIHEIDPSIEPDVASAIEAYAPEARPAIEAAVAACLADGTPFDLELPFVTARGRSLWVRAIGAAEVQGGRIVRIFGAMQDITRQKQAERKSAESEALLRGITDHLPALIAEIGLDFRCRFSNATYRTWLGVDPASLSVHPMEKAEIRDYFAGREPYLERAAAGEKVVFEQQVRLLTGERCLQTSYVPHFDDTGAVAGIYALTNDITPQKEIQQQLDLLARVDALTGLPNRRQFEERVVDAMARTRRSGVALAVIYLDIDDFKAINDTHGHGGGDAVLKEFARRLRGAVRETDTVARYAGDEFVVLLEGVGDATEAATVANKVVAAVRPEFEVFGRAVQVTASAGVATYRGGDAALEPLLARADAALYRAKSSGRDRVDVAA